MWIVIGIVIIAVVVSFALIAIGIDASIERGQDQRLRNDHECDDEDDHFAQ